MHSLTTGNLKLQYLSDETKHILNLVRISAYTGNYRVNTNDRIELNIQHELKVLGYEIIHGENGDIVSWEF